MIKKITGYQIPTNQDDSGVGVTVVSAVGDGSGMGVGRV
jgi:hypothetical protein